MGTCNSNTLDLTPRLIKVCPFSVQAPPWLRFLSLSDIEWQIRSLVLYIFKSNYVSSPHSPHSLKASYCTPHVHACIHAHILTRTRSHTCVILPFLPPNIDLTKSDALEIVRFVNPQGWWTISPLTKLELGIHMFKLTGFTHLLKLGFVASSIACSARLTQTRASTTRSKAMRRFSEVIWSTDHHTHDRQDETLQDNHPVIQVRTLPFVFLVRGYRQVFLGSYKLYSRQVA